MGRGRKSSLVAGGMRPKRKHLKYFLPSLGRKFVLGYFPLFPSSCSVRYCEYTSILRYCDIVAKCRTICFSQLCDFFSIVCFNCSLHKGFQHRDCMNRRPGYVILEFKLQFSIVPQMWRWVLAGFIGIGSPMDLNLNKVRCYGTSTWILTQQPLDA